MGGDWLWPSYSCVHRLCEDRAPPPPARHDWSETLQNEIERVMKKEFVAFNWEVSLGRSNRISPFWNLTRHGMLLGGCPHWTIESRASEQICNYRGSKGLLAALPLSLWIGKACGVCLRFRFHTCSKAGNLKKKKPLGWMNENLRSTTKAVCLNLVPVSKNLVTCEQQRCTEKKHSGWMFSCKYSSWWRTNVDESFQQKLDEIWKNSH